MLKLTQEEKMTTEELRNLSGLQTSDVNQLMKALMLVTLINFSEKDDTVIPYFGTLKIKYKGDKTSINGRIADLNVEFIPSPTLVKNIGQLVDVRNPSCDTKVTDVDCIKEILTEIGNKLNSLMRTEN